VPASHVSTVQHVSGRPVYGVDVDPETRCEHYHSDLDVVAFRFACCERYYPCVRCHEAVAGHEAVPWPRDRFDEPSVLCGACGVAMTASDYLSCGSRCPHCEAAFNPGCRSHLTSYLER
jgi:uncharacterized CHY-type Zn-finger protein